MSTSILPPKSATSGQLVTVDGRTLPLVGTRLDVSAGGGLARTRLVQRFANRYQEPLTVTYQLPLPADGAVAAFAFVVGERRIEGVIEGRQQARERFEQALASGHSAALLEQDRTALFQQKIGNIPPGSEVVAEITVDQPLAWSGDGWEFRFPTTVAPRYLGADGRVPDAERQAVDVAAQPLPPRLELQLLVQDALVPSTQPTSASHALDVDLGADAEGCRVALAAGKVRLDRDVVVTWRVGAPEVGAGLTTARPPATTAHGADAFGLLTLVPPAGTPRAVPRDLTVLLDTSGSMSGRPLAQAKAVVAALVESLADTDRLQLIEFSNAPRRWQRRPVAATARSRQQALHWLAGLQASGGTEMHAGVMESLAALDADRQSQVLLVTDGLVGFEAEVVAALLHRLPRACRFHVLGVGSAPNRALSAACARAGRGAEAFADLDEEAGAAATRLIAAMCAPVIVDLQVSGDALIDAAPVQLPDLFAGAPAQLSLRLRPAGGTLCVVGHGADGTFVRELQVPATADGSGRPEVVTRYGRERVEDLEMRVVAGDAVADAEAEIERLGRQFALATRFTSWLAVSNEPTVDPRAPARREDVAQELPYGMSVEGLGLRPAMGAALSEVACEMAPGGAAFDDECVDGLAKRDAGKFEVRSALPRRRHAEPAAKASPTPPIPPPPAPKARRPRLARLLLRDGHGLRLAFEVDGLTWSLPDTVELRWQDGTTLVVRVEAARSTRSGAVGAGAEVLLQLELPATAPTAPPAMVVVHGEALAVVVPSR